MDRTLVLNATFEPLGVVHLNRAVVLVLSGRAEIVEAAARVMRSPSMVVAAPTVIRMAAMVQAPFRTTVPLTRRGVLMRDQSTCAYCGRRGGTLTLDHVTPRSRGGRHCWENVVTCCSPCNAKKADRTPHEARMPLRFQPRVPRGAAAASVRYEVRDPSWEPYLALGG